MDWQWLLSFDNSEPNETPLSDRQRAFLVSAIASFQYPGDWINGTFDDIEAFLDDLLAVLS